MRRRRRRHTRATHTRTHATQRRRKRERERERNELDCFRDICRHRSDWSTCSGGAQKGVEEGGGHEEEEEEPKSPSRWSPGTWFAKRNKEKGVAKLGAGPFKPWGSPGQTKDLSNTQKMFP